MRVFLAVLAVILVGLSGLAGCQATAPSASAPAPTGITITDDAGRTIHFNGAPQRIISLAPSNTEMVYALNLQDRLIGVTTYDNYPPKAKEKPQVSEYSQVDVEKIVSLQPDLILADSIHKAEVIPALEKLGVNVVMITPGTIEQVLNELTLIGEICGKSDQTAALVESLRQRVNAVVNKVNQPASGKPRVLFVTWYDPIWTAGDNTMIGDLFAKAGAINIAGDLDGYATITLEEAIQRNPQIIVVTNAMGEQNESLNYIISEPRFQVIDAVKNRQVFEIDTDIFGRTTPRIVDGLEQLAKIVHPELFK
jgi:iron complex transport system substrate-binding protein